VTGFEKNFKLKVFLYHRLPTILCLKHCRTHALLQASQGGMEDSGLIGSGTQDASPSRFVDYMSTQRLPARRADVRGLGNSGLTLALVDHAPSKGIWFDPVDDLIISVVIAAKRSRVTRDVGFGKADHPYASGTTLLTPPGRGSYWQFDSTPLILHLGVPAGMIAAVVGDDFRDPGDAMLAAARAPSADTLVAQIAARMWAASREPADRSRSFLKTGLDAMLTLLLCTPDARESGKAPRLAAWRMRKVTHVIAERKLRVSIPDLAASVGLSPDHFIRAFKATAGCSPYEMASRTAIEEAKHLLRSTARPVTDIAFDLGYSSSAHFSSRFRQLTGMSPTDWRATYRN